MRWLSEFRAWGIFSLGALHVGLATMARAAAEAPSQLRQVRVAGIVLKWIRGDKEANYRRVEPLIREAARQKAVIVITTECFLDGYAIADKNIPLADYLALGEPIPTGSYCKRLAALAAELKIHLVAGMTEADGAARYNTAVLFGPDGTLLGKYRKQKLEHEAVRNSPGKSYPVHETRHGRIGMMICADRRDPDLVGRLGINGADFLICPSGGMFGPRSNDPILQARSKETRLPIVFVHPAEFLVTGPDGAILRRELLGNVLLVTRDQVGGEKDENKVCWLDLPIAAKPAAGPAPAGRIEITVVDRKSSRPVPCRIHLVDAAGKPQRAAGLPFFHDHFVCAGKVAIHLAPGKYAYEVERGPEYSRSAGTFIIEEKGEANRQVELERLTDLPAEGWWPGDLHIHRPIEEIELLMQAEDLHIAPVITWWNNRNQWATQKRLPEKPLVQFDRYRWYHLMAGEDEREGGALLYFNFPRPLPITGASREYPSPVKFLAEARREKNVWVDIEKPFWWDVPIWLAGGQVDSIGLANNHMCRSRMYESEAWGRPRDAERLPPPLGNGWWSQEVYYHLLNCGIRLPPSAGSASGVLPNPVGYNRVYVYTGPELGYEQWWEGLRAGRCFVTNGPLLRVEAGGKLPGQTFTGEAGQEIKLDVKAKLTARDPIRFLEIVRNGQVERRVPFAEWSKTGSLGTVRFTRSGWFLVRAIADEPRTFRFASTAPFFVEIGPNRRTISKKSAQFFLDWVQERAKRVKLEDPEQREEVLRHHRQAETFWRNRLAQATEE